METPQSALELTIDDILFLHRHWILQLYVEERKSEGEIVSLLLVKIHKCLTDWGAIPSSPPPTAASKRHSTRTAQHPQHLQPQHHHPPHPPSPDPAITDRYKRRALPSIPTSFSRSTDLLKVTCHHGPSQSHEVETTLDFVPKGPSQLDLYATSDQSHERFAVGLERTPRRRQGQAWSSAPARRNDHHHHHHHHHRSSRLGSTTGDKEKRKKHRRGGEEEEEEKKRDS